LETTARAKFETAKLPGYEGLRLASDIIDRKEIESQAWALINQRDSLPVPKVFKHERRDNARTALMEALTASGHLSEVRISGSLEDINSQVLGRLLNGWNDNLPFHEKQRRFAELCNELVIQEVHRSIAAGDCPATTAVAEISDYPLTFDSQTAMSLGYRASNKKGMVRSTRLERKDDNGYTRVIEQTSRSNGTPASTFRFFKASGMKTKTGELADLAVLNAPFLYSGEDYINHTIDIVRRLDQQELAPVLYGDTSDKAGRHASYDELREESARREAEIEGFIDKLAALEKQLDKLKQKGRIDYEESQSIFKSEVDRILTAICTLEPAYAEDTFGKAAAAKFTEAGQLYAGGHADLAQQALQSANYLKEEVTFCGMSISVEQAQKEGLKVNGYRELIEKARKDWQWKKGVCQVKECPTRPAKTEVGPCSVCRKCQNIFDNGDKPERIYKALNFLDWLFGAGEKNT
jgi:hypothetical protein